MSKRNDTIDIKPVLKAIKAHGKALETAHNRFRAILAAIVECGATRLFTTPANKLAKHEKAALRRIIETARRVYAWQSESAPRVFKRRIKMELERPGAIAALSKMARDKAKASDKASDKAKTGGKTGAKDAGKRTPRTPAEAGSLTVSRSRMQAIAESVYAAMKLANSDAQRAHLADALAILKEWLDFEG